MTVTTTEPKIIEHEPWDIVGMYVIAKSDHEPWGEAMTAFERRRADVTNRVDDIQLAFLYRPHRDDPSVPESAQACFIGFEVTDLDHIPEGMAATRFSGGRFVMVECCGDTEDAVAAAIGDVIRRLETWIPEHGYTEGEACFCLNHEYAKTPPFQWDVYIKIEELSS